MNPPSSLHGLSYRLPHCIPSPTRRPLRVVLPIVCLVMLASCASGPPGGPGRGAEGGRGPATRPVLPADTGRDGPEANPPPDLHQVPDAQPRLEAVRPGGPNKPYEVLGRAYTPLAGDPPLVERGLASWYGRKFHGRPTASGEVYNMYAMTAAHKTMPLPSYARVRNPANGREVVLRVNDRGPFHPGRVIDLSYTAALKLGVLGGVAKVEVERITYDAIRTGAWRVPPAADAGEAIPVGAPTLRADARPGQMPPPAAADDPIAEIARRSAALVVVGGTGAPNQTDGAGAAAAMRQPLPSETTAPARAAALAAPGFWLQLGAFSRRDGAVGFQQRVATEVGWLAPLMAIFNERSLHRLQAGPYASRADAQGAADRLRDALQLVPAIVERR